jgi:hypothetical protein
MSIEILLYLAGVAESIKGISGIGILVAGFGLMFACIVIVIEEGDSPLKKAIRPFAKLLVMCVIINIITPSKQTMYSMIAIKAGKQIANNSNTNELLNKTYSIINNKLDKMLSENKQ